MRRYIYLWAIVVMLLLLLNPSLGYAEEREIYPNIIRLHILANSNNKKDQELKLIVRDKILAKIDLREAKDQEEAWQYLEKNLERIKDFSQMVIKEKGYNYKVNLQLTIEEFPYREYGSHIYPPGKYQALKITIGEGQGQNWWCVLYPPLCHEALYDEFDDDQVMQVKGSVYNQEVKEKTEAREILELFLKVVKSIWLI